MSAKPTFGRFKTLVVETYIHTTLEKWGFRLTVRTPEIQRPLRPAAL